MAKKTELKNNTEPAVAVDTVLAPVKWRVDCEDKYHYYRNYIIEANTEDEALHKFLEIKCAPRNRFINMTITPIK